MWKNFLLIINFFLVNVGVFFLASASLLVTDWLKDANLKSTVIIIGYFMGIILFPVVNLCYIAVFLVKKRIRQYVPLWLIVSNIFFLLALAYFIFYLNDPYYHQK